MSITYKKLDPQDFEDSFDEIQAFALDVLVGLSETRKSLPSKYLYDSVGSELFTEITKSPDYYLTDCEREILVKHASEIAEQFSGAPLNLIELGAGIGEKTKILLSRFTELGIEFQYVPIDISEGAMKELMADLKKTMPDVETNGLVSDYFSGMKWLNNRYKRRNFVLFLGSSIGNFNHAGSRTFLRNAWNSLNHEDCLLTGFDLKKDIEALLLAYNDTAGVTSRFNLNLLARINTELGGTFDLKRFRHYGTYNVFNGAMESFLVSMEDQDVYIDTIGRSFSFREWEPIHTEYSYKYLESDIKTLAVETGFRVVNLLFDSRHFFADSIWKVHKPGA
jgi:L-histidine Nalpha-methyltransferase